MDYKKANTLILNGQLHPYNGLAALAQAEISNPKIPGWQRSIFSFLLDWLDDRDFIEVKTSGSTGAPKNIRVRKQFMVNSALKTGDFLNLEKGGQALLCLPATYIAGKMMLVRAMVFQMNLIVEAPSSNPLQNTNEHIDFAAMIPTQVHEMLKTRGGVLKLNSIKNLIIGGAPLSAILRDEVKRLTNNSFMTYGMTETVTHIAMERLNGSSADGWLHALPGIAVSTDQSGRLIIDAPGITNTTVETNDLATIKDNRTFRIIGRSDNVFISGGVNIIPEEIEKKIEHLVTENFIVSSIPDEKFGAVAVLVIEGKSPGPNRQKELLSAISAALPKHQHLKKIIPVKTFPVTGNQKTDRKKIREIISES